MKLIVPKQEVELSIIIPALNERPNVGPLTEQVQQHVLDAGITAELIVVDDGSDDGTLDALKQLAKTRPWLVVLHRRQPRGQSAAMHAGIRAARGRFIATLDADLQNDPADLPVMLRLLHEQGADMVQGDRSGARQDTLIRRWGSIVGRTARRWVLNDPVRDTGCSTRVVRAEVAKQFPLQFKGMHRFMPAYAHILGAKVIQAPVTHRPRAAGRSKYGLGILTRGPAGLYDLFAVRWMASRYRNTSTEPLAKPIAEPAAEPLARNPP